jgi:delta14-sterol reductase
MDIKNDVNFWLGFRAAIQLPSIQVVGWCIAYLVLIAILGRLPGKMVHGTKLSNGTALSYKINGFLILIVLLIAGWVSTVQLKLFSATVLYDNFGPICMTANIFALLLSVFLYIKGRYHGAKVSGSFFHDFIAGLELNPRILGVDVKLFSLRPTMMGWLFLNLSFLAEHVKQTGSISVSMALYQIFTAIYVLDYFWNETYMLSTWDIIAEHYGLYLVWGDYVWIPFTFTIQNWFLLKSSSLHPALAACTVLLFVCGYIVFRMANKQKHDFKHNPQGLIAGKPPRVIGKSLLCSGFWAYSRHPNYLGDIFLAFSYSLPCSYTAITAYLYPIYLTALLIHRERRDEERCSAKYGEDWKRYRTEVPYRIVPYLY